MTGLVILAGAAQVAPQWSRVEPLFQTAVDHAVHGEFTVQDIKTLALSRGALIAYIEEDNRILMVMALEIRRYPRMAVLNIMAMAGERMDELFGEHCGEFARFAIHEGISYFEASASKAMSKMLRGCGWVHAYDIVRYKL